MHTRCSAHQMRRARCLHTNVRAPVPLQAKAIKFAPPLPRWKKDAIERLGFGPIEKVALLL